MPPASSVQSWLVDQVEAALGARAFRRQLVFGCPTFFANGRVFAVVWEGPRLVMKFTEPSDARTLRALPGADDWFPRRTGPAVEAAVLVPESMHEDDEVLAHWLGRAWRQVMDLPPPAPKRRKRAPRRRAR